ncbi:hypothetical protein Cni_G01207 [Canna indica]|uniref:Uncharacterized protein n=1 Tax=Canna indica TaxID=4628 RepID=A0AAQ3JP99_9LILI|nr:hypothetical protein Cni_G01207 [Canna indica]
MVLPIARPLIEKHATTVARYSVKRDKRNAWLPDYIIYLKNQVAGLGGGGRSASLLWERRERRLPDWVGEAGGWERSPPRQDADRRIECGRSEEGKGIVICEPAPAGMQIAAGTQ